MHVHPSQISPAESFDIFYFLRNHTDAATYYVRAVVYDVRTGEVLQTVNLEQSPTNARLFIKAVQAPPDPTGYGRNIVAIASVYSDSGYTIKSTDYEEQEQPFLVKAVAPLLGGGFDYRTLGDFIEPIIRRELQQLPSPNDYQSAFNAIFGAIGALQRELNRVPKDVFDPAPILDALGEVRHQLTSLPGNDDLAPIEAAQVNLLESVGKVRSDLKSLRASRPTDPADHTPVVEKATQEISEAIRSALAAVVAHVSAPTEEPGPKEPQLSPIDISHLFT
jgi:hypothetical protein